MKKNTIPVCEIPELTIGLDLSDRSFQFCELNAAGEIVEEGNRKLDRATLAKVSGGPARGRACRTGDRRSIGLGAGLDRTTGR